MKFLDFLIKLKTFFDLFKKSDSAKDETNSAASKVKRIVMILALVLTGILILAGIVLLIRKLKQRRMQKEAEDALDDFYSTDPDADEYDPDDEEAE